MHILLVEPDMQLARTYRLALQAAGHEVSHATTAQAAITAADHSQPELVILEMQLVSHSGIEFLYEFRSYSDWTDIPVMVCSVVPPAEFRSSWDLLRHELGVVAYHYKPHTSLDDLQRLANRAVMV